MKRIFTLSAFALLVAGCTTNIHDKNETITAPSEPLKTFTQVIVKPLLSKAPADEFSDTAVARVQEDLNKCLPGAFQGVSAYNPASPAAGVRTLLVEPSIVDGKKVSGAQRFFFGAMAGSSAVLMEVKFTNMQTKTVLAQPIFYAKANAMGGAWTVGGTDNAMLTRLANDACTYVKTYRP